MTDEHKQAIAAGRAEARAVKAYLEALEANRPKQGRRRTPEAIRARLDKIERAAVEAAPLRRLELLQQRIDLRAELAQLESDKDASDLEEGFTAVAASYGARKGIAYSTWREIGVPASVLKKAGIERRGDGPGRSLVR